MQGGDGGLGVAGLDGDDQALNVRGGSQVLHGAHERLGDLYAIAIEQLLEEPLFRQPGWHG